MSHEARIAWDWMRWAYRKTASDEGFTSERINRATREIGEHAKRMSPSKERHRIFVDMLYPGRAAGLTRSEASDLRYGTYRILGFSQKTAGLMVKDKTIITGYAWGRMLWYVENCLPIAKVPPPLRQALVMRAEQGFEWLDALGKEEGRMALYDFDYDHPEVLPYLPQRRTER